MLYNDGGDGIRAKIWFPKQQRLDIYVNGMFMNPNNLDFESVSYNLLPPDDSFIPVLTEPQGANYFDPNSGHLYLIVKGPGTIEIKTQPIVVLKLGMTVPIENFFEENVVANLAGLLGIDPANIRVTNIVREGSVSGRKKRAVGDVIEVEVTIGPPPLLTLGNEFLPEEYTYTTPNPISTTVNPAYTTETPVTVTTEWIAPATHMDFDALAAVSANLVNSFQTGGLDLGVDITDFSLEAPVQPPEAPPPYTSAADRAQLTELTFAEQQAVKNTAQLGQYETKALAVPTALVVLDEPVFTAEMTVPARPVKVHAHDRNGAVISDLGFNGDPWLCTVSVLSGPGGTLMGTTTVQFTNGIATFDDIYMGQAGDNNPQTRSLSYVLQFLISYPVGITSVAPVSSLPFNVAPLVPQNPTSSVTTTPDICKQRTFFYLAYTHRHKLLCLLGLLR